jgi:hypothetical protein
VAALQSHLPYGGEMQKLIKNSTDLIFVHIDSKTPYVLTMDLWKGFEYKTHEYLKRVIKSNESRFLERGILNFTESSIKGRGQPEKSYVLNERQFRLLCLLVKNTPNSVDIKSAIEEEFDRLEKENELLLKQQSNKNWLEAREAAKTSFKFMNTLLMEARKEHGKETKSHHYSNEARLVNYAMTGKFEGMDRKNLTEIELAMLFDLQAYNSRLIAKDMQYKDIKIALTVFSENWKNPKISTVKEPSANYLVYQ